MNDRRVLIVGAGVAGLSAAWWLAEAGWRVFVVERAANLRDGGYVMGLSGPGLAIAGRMGILPALESAARTINENIYYNSQGREILRLRYRDFLKDLPYIALQRTDLVAALAKLVQGKVEIRYELEVEGVEQGNDSATVVLSNGGREEVDLVIGADGTRSALRRLLFGPDEAFMKPLGCRFAAYDIPDDLNIGADFLSYAEPGHLAEYYTVSGDRLAALQVWRSEKGGFVPPERRWDLLLDVASSSFPAVREMIGIGRKWEAIPIVDDLALVDMPKWSQGRVVLVGDAAHCMTLLSGQGAGIALASVEILAKELSEHPLSEALARHELRLRPAIVKLQERSRRMAAVFIPSSRISFHLRNVMLRYMPRYLLRRYFLNSVRSEIVASEALVLPASP